MTFLAVLFISAGCTANPPAEQKMASAKKDDGLCAASVGDMIANADKARKKAASVSGEWRDTKKMIKKAKGMMEKGECGKALKIAKKAKQQGELGYEQAVSQKELKMPAYFKF